MRTRRWTSTWKYIADADVGILELLDPLPRWAVVTSGNNRIVRPLYAGHSERFHYQVRFRRRARVTLGGLRQRWHDPSALVRWEQELPASSELTVRPRATPIAHPVRPVRTQVFMGNYPAPTIGEGLEIAELRPHVPGDRLRSINWRASLRMGTLHVNDYAPERNADVVLLLDTFADAGPPGVRLLDTATRIAASLADHFLAARNRVGLIELSGILKWVIPASGPRQRYRLFENLTDVAVRQSYVGQNLRTIPARILPSRAFIIAISGLVDARFAFAAGDLHARGFNVVLVVLDAAGSRGARDPDAATGRAQPAAGPGGRGPVAAGVGRTPAQPAARRSAGGAVRRGYAAGAGGARHRPAAPLRRRPARADGLTGSDGDSRPGADPSAVAGGVRTEHRCLGRAGGAGHRGGGPGGRRRRAAPLPVAGRGRGAAAARVLDRRADLRARC